MSSFRGPLYPECELIATLAQRAEEKQDTEFDFLGQLDIFRKRVAEEVNQINVLFPEYTPHDEQYHLKRLFHVASTLIGIDNFKLLNCAEIFVLAVSLYGHDWGMAISEAEKSHLLYDESQEGIDKQDFWTLPDEQDRLLSFARKNLLLSVTDNSIKKISDENWRNYIRETHAFRSSERVRRYFEFIDGGVAEAASRVCLGHWIDFEQLQDYRMYPPDFAVMGESVNLRALTVYLRLSDLLDLSEDRTPYVIWKFVAPHDPTSRMEWNKHRSLRPITCKQYQLGRVIQVDGSTDDHETYAALEDLRNYCDEQLRECNDLIARMNDPRHNLNIYHIDWRVTPRGFNPVLMRFEFDRQRMFDVLSDEIYQGDSHIFLRELLQNSIDAIRMRREILDRKGFGSDKLGVIHFDVEHYVDGRIVVTCCDDGAGMDEYIIRRYLAIAGKSYYRSKDFERQGLAMDPISRFGVGLLSCFMVAGKLEIETYRDPYLSSGDLPLRIAIPAIDRQFRIETIKTDIAKVGTTVRVFIDPQKINTKLEVTNYLQTIAGFVDFPVVVTEDGKKTVVVNPLADKDKLITRFGNEIDIQALDLKFNWSDAFYRRDLLLAKDTFTEEHYDITKDLGLSEYSGVLIFLVPRDKTTHSSINKRFSYNEKVIVIDSQRKNQIDISLGDRGEFRRYNRTTPSPSAIQPYGYVVYKDGILIPQADPPLEFGWSYLSANKIHSSLNRGIPNPLIIVNIQKRNGNELDLSRLMVKKTSNHWFSEVYSAFVNHVSETKVKHIQKLSPVNRFLELSNLSSRYGLSEYDLWRIFPHKKWPIICLDPDGKLHVYEWCEVCSDILFTPPKIIKNEINKAINLFWLNHNQRIPCLSKWIGKRCVVKDFNGLPPIDNGSAICKEPIESTHIVSSIQFLSPPWYGDPPLVQKVMTLKDNRQTKIDAKIILQENKKKYKRYKRYSDLECRVILKHKYYFSFPDVYKFPVPFEHYFAYGGEFINSSHRFTQAIVGLIEDWILAKKEGLISEINLDLFDDAMRELSFCWRKVPLPMRDWTKHLRKICQIANKIGLSKVENVRDNIPNSKAFIPGTVGKKASKLQLNFSDINRVKPFGQHLK